MTDEMLDSIEKKAEAFPVLLIKQEMMVDPDGKETPLPYEDFLLQKVNEEGVRYLGRTEASFTEAEAEFIAEARGDLLALVQEVRVHKARFEELVADFRKLQEEMDAAWSATGSGAKGMVSLEEVVRTKVEEWFAMHGALLDSRAEHERTSSILRNLSEAARERIKQINETL